MNSTGRNYNVSTFLGPSLASLLTRYRALGRVLLLSTFVLSIACESPTAKDDSLKSNSSSNPHALRVVSLSPALSSTIEYLEAEKSLVGTSDFYSGTLKLPKLGSALTPHFEAILRAKPDLIVMTKVNGDQGRQLSELAKTQEYPWLTVEEIASSVELFGQALGKTQKAKKLAHRLRAELITEVAKDAPAIYLTWESQDGSSGRYFVKRNSAHGAILRAAGGKNAVERDIPGYPKLSTEELIHLNPFGIIVLRDGPPDQAKEAFALKDLRKLKGLDAVTMGRLKTLSAPGILSMGPSLLHWIQPMEKIIKKMTSLPAEVKPLKPMTSSP